MDSNKIVNWKNELTRHLTEELLPFWVTRCRDVERGGFLTQFDEFGNDSGLDEKSLLAHMRTVYSLSIAHEYGYDADGISLSLAKDGVHFAVSTYWDALHGGFYWLFNRKNEVVIDRKILYGQSFAIYALSTYSRVSGDPIGLEYAERTFDLLKKYAAETAWGGYLEMFSRDWTLSGPGPEGGDRKTLDVHMHLMEAFTALYLAGKRDVHRRALEEIIELLRFRLIHQRYGTGIPQFYRDWTVAPQIKFDVVWGWDRFQEGDNKKTHDLDNTSYGHNVEFFWLLTEAERALGRDPHRHDELFIKILDHALATGIDWDFGGVYVEGSHDGSSVYDTSKEFWQQAEFLTGMLDAYLLYHHERYLEAYENVHRFVLDRMVNHDTGEWWPLLTREGEPIWRHMSHSWKVNYHTIRGTVMAIGRLNRVLREP